jgi:hypothetical protein
MRDEMENMRQRHEEERNNIAVGIPMIEQQQNYGSPNRRCNIKIIITIVLVILAAVIIIVAVATTSTLGDKGDKGSLESPSSPTAAPVHDDDSQPTTMTFKTKFDLRQALLSEGDQSSIEHWDVSAISDFTGLFDATNGNRLAMLFNGDISKWDLSSAVSLERMFAGAINFNQDLSGWNVSLVESIDSIFEGATSFNHDLSAWNVVRLTNMNNAFYGATSFRQDLCDWANRLPLTSTAEGNNPAFIATSQAFTGTSCPVDFPITLLPTNTTLANNKSFGPGPFCFPCSSPL